MAQLPAREGTIDARIIIPHFRRECLRLAKTRAKLDRRRSAREFTLACESFPDARERLSRQILHEVHSQNGPDGPREPGRPP